MKRLFAAFLGATIFASCIATTAAKNDPGQAKLPALQVQSSYPVVVTDKLIECRDFYVHRLGFEVVFEATWFVLMTSGGDHPYSIAFMTPDHPSRPPGPEAFDGRGAFLTLQVADAAADYERLKKAGVTMAYAVKDEPWGQRRFAMVDPSGMWVDVVQQIEPAPGFWDEYMPQP